MRVVRRPAISTSVLSMSDQTLSRRLMKHVNEWWNMGHLRASEPEEYELRPVRSRYNRSGFIAMRNRRSICQLWTNWDQYGAGVRGRCIGGLVQRFRRRS